MLRLDEELERDELRLDERDDVLRLDARDGALRLDGLELEALDLIVLELADDFGPDDRGLGWLEPDGRDITARDGAAEDRIDVERGA